MAAAMQSVRLLPRPIWPYSRIQEADLAAKKYQSCSRSVPCRPVRTKEDVDCGQRAERNGGSAERTRSRECVDWRVSPVQKRHGLVGKVGKLGAVQAAGR